MKIVWILIAVVFLSACGGRETPAPQQTAAAIASGAPGDPGRGKALVAQYGCLACHIVPGVDGPRGRLGPSLAGMASRPVINGRFANTPENMMRWLQSPRAMDPTATMPNSGATPDQVRDMTAFLFTLK